MKLRLDNEYDTLYFRLDDSEVYDTEEIESLIIEWWGLRF